MPVLKICMANGCERERKNGRRFCNRHRYILEKFGCLEKPRDAKTARRVSSREVEEWTEMYMSGLNTIEIGKLYNRHCSVIYNNLKTKGVIRNRSDVKWGDLNPMWVGNSVSNTALHAWVKRNKPKPDLCEHCTEAPPYDLANVSQEYKRDVNDFQWLCRRCHMLSDGRMKNLRQYANGC